MKELLYELLDAGGKEHHTLNSPEVSIMMGDHFWISYHNKRADKGIKARQIFNESLRSWVKRVKYKQAEIRFTRKGFEPLTETIIRNDKLGIIIWAEKPLGILVHNRIIAESYDRYFEYMWEQAKP